MDESDTFLVKRAIRGDREAFSQLYFRYADQIYRFARFRLQNRDDAEDLTSGVFLNAWGSIKRFSPKHDSSFGAWLFKIARHAVTDTYRRARDVVSLDAMESIPVDEATASLEDVLEARLTLLTLYQALNMLTSEQRDVVILRFFVGLSAREVGDILGKQENAVRGMQFRALEAMRRALERAREGDTLD